MGIPDSRQIQMKAGQQWFGGDGNGRFQNSNLFRRVEIELERSPDHDKLSF